MRFELLDDLAPEGCPMCNGAGRIARDWLRGLLRDIDDAKVRVLVERDGGLCPRHIRILVEVALAEGDTLGLAVVFKFLLGAASRELDRLGKRRVVAGGRRARRAGKKRRGAEVRPCAACQAEERRVAAYIELLKDRGDTEVQRGVRGPHRSLCLEHLEAVYDGDGDPKALAGLRSSTRSKLEALQSAVEESIRAHSVGVHALPDVHDVLSQDVPTWLAGPG